MIAALFSKNVEMNSITQRNKMQAPENTRISLKLKKIFIYAFNNSPMLLIMIARESGNKNHKPIINFQNSFRIINENFMKLNILGNKKFKLYNATSPYNIHYFDGDQEMGTGYFDPTKGCKIIHSPVYESGSKPFNLQLQQYFDPVLQFEVLYVRNLGTPLTYKVSGRFYIHVLPNFSAKKHF